MLTIFSTAKPFEGHSEIIQRNAIKSWTLLDPQPEIILFGNEPGVQEIAYELGLVNVPEIATNEYGTPLLNDMFEKAQRIASNDIMCYVNADVILMDDFIDAVKKVQGIDEFLMVSRRWDVAVDSMLRFEEPGWQDNLRDFVEENGELRSPGGIDCFVYKGRLFNSIPPFAIGRLAWDNWLLYQARRMKASLIDATEAVMLVHQNHDYSNLGGISDEELVELPEVKYNLKLSGGADFWWLVSDAQFLVTREGLVRAGLQNRSLARWMKTSCLLHPFFGFLLHPYFRFCYKAVRYMVNIVRPGVRASWNM